MYNSCPDTFRMVRCSSCAHIYLNPRPTRETVAIIYPETYASFRGVLARPSLMSRVKKAIVTRRFRTAMGSNQQARVLEIGCGEGQLLMAIREAFPTVELTGLDWRFDPHFETLLKSLDITLITGLAENAHLPRDHYDIIIMNQLIEHLWDLDSVLTACHGALKPGGTLTVETPNSDGYDRKMFRKGAWGNYYFPRHFNLFSRDGLRRVLERHGFEIRQSINLLAPLTWIFTMNSLAHRHVALRWLRKVFTIMNVPAVAFFAAIDFVVSATGASTSNQKMNAVKR